MNNIYCFQNYNDSAESIDDLKCLFSNPVGSMILYLINIAICPNKVFLHSLHETHISSNDWLLNILPE